MKRDEWGELRSKLTQKWLVEDLEELLDAVSDDFSARHVDKLITISQGWLLEFRDEVVNNSIAAQNVVTLLSLVLRGSQDPNIEDLLRGFLSHSAREVSVRAKHALWHIQQVRECSSLNREELVTRELDFDAMLRRVDKVLWLNQNTRECKSIELQAEAIRALLNSCDLTAARSKLIQLELKFARKSITGTAVQHLGPTQI